jgi:hypothetical protein
LKEKLKIAREALDEEGIETFILITKCKAKPALSICSPLKRQRDIFFLLDVWNHLEDNISVIRSNDDDDFVLDFDPEEIS